MSLPRIFSHAAKRVRSGVLLSRDALHLSHRISFHQHQQKQYISYTPVCLKRHFSSSSSGENDTENKAEKEKSNGVQKSENGEKSGDFIADVLGIDHGFSAKNMQTPHDPLLPGEKEFSPSAFAFGGESQSIDAVELPPLRENAYILDRADPKCTLIWLHGFHEERENPIRLFQMISPDTLRVVIPFAEPLPITALDEHEKRSWFDIYEDNLHDNPYPKEDEYGLEIMGERLSQLLEEECERIGSSEHVVIGGFGHGGAMALYAGLTYKQKLGGIVSFCGYLPLMDSFESLISPENSNTPVLAFHGKGDHMIPFEYAKERYEVLKEIGVPVDWRPRLDLDHFMSPDSMLEMQYWWMSQAAKK